MLFRTARKTFLERLDLAAIQAATREAEAKTSGEIRVSIFPGIPGSIDAIARKVAERLKMTATKERNGVLILVLPGKRKFIVWGDRAIHEKAGPEFFTVTAAAISERFAKGDFTGGLVHGIQALGAELATHFPAQGPHENQLPNDVDR